MKPSTILWLILILVTGALSQSQPNASPSTTGKCSVANAGSSNTITINCGVDRKQGERIIALLNKVLAGQSDSEAMMKKVDACLTQAVPRSIAPELRQPLIDALKQKPGQAAYKVKLSLYNGTPESLRYAQQLLEVFEAAGWGVTPDPRLGPILPYGLGVLVHTDKSAPGIMVQQAFKKAGITADYHLDPKEAPDDSTIVVQVGNKPVE